MEKQTLRAYNLEAAKAVFSYLQVKKELRAHEVNTIICYERGWDPYHITLSWNFNTIKQFLKDHGLAKKVVVNTNHVKWVATEKTLNARSFESAIAETPEERVEAFKQRYAKEPETYEKPPIGVIPREIWVEKILEAHKEERLNDLKRAITEYVNAGLLIPKEWTREYDHLVRNEGNI